MTTETPNVLFPGRPNYTGPISGRFGLLHHSDLFETSHDVNKRIAYVKANKPEGEVKLRLHNMVYLGAIASTCDKRDALDAEVLAKRAPLDADYLAKRAPLDADWQAKRDALDAEVLAYIKTVMPDCAWNGKKLTGTED